MVVLAVLAGPVRAGSTPCAVVDDPEGGHPPAASDPDEPEPTLAAAHRALDEGRPDEADAICRVLLETDPDDAEAYALLQHIAMARPIPRESHSARSARAVLPDPVEEYETEHYLVLSRADARWTRRQANQLERVWDEYHRYARRLGLRPLPPRHKLVCVLLAHRAEFDHFARVHDQMSSGWSFGYYALRDDRIVLYNGEAEPGADEFADTRSIATITHEAVHQLLYHTRVQDPHVQYPLWISEGLATAFETGRARDAFGPRHEFEPRRARFDWMLETGHLFDLSEFVGLDAMPDRRRRTVHVVYNQSYGLVSWLSRHRREELCAYLALMRRQPPGRAEAGRHRRVFESAFGDVARLERRWLRDEIERIGPDRVPPSLRRRLRIASTRTDGSYAAPSSTRSRPRPGARPHRSGTTAFVLTPGRSAPE